MGLVDALPRVIGPASTGEVAALPDAVILDDEPHIAELAARVCDEVGLSAAAYRTPAAFLAAFGTARPRLVILDWRLERDNGAAAFMALRHRFADVPIVCWTGMAPETLPAMVAGDPRTRVVRKAGRLQALVDAIRWACGQSAAGPSRRRH